MSKITTKRFKDRHQFTAEEEFLHQRDGTWPESPEYRDLKRMVLADAGLEDDEGSGSQPLSEQTTEDHLKRIQKGR